MPTPRRRQLGTRGLSRSGQCDGRERASPAGLTRGRGPPAAGAGAGGCGRRRGAAGHRSGSALWAGAALAGGLRRAPSRVSKDGQRVGRRPHPRRPLARVRVSPAAGEVGRSEPSSPGGAGRRGERAARETRPPPSPRAAERRQWPCGAEWEGGRVGPGGGEVGHTCAPGLAEAAGSGQR